MKIVEPSKKERIGSEAGPRQNQEVEFDQGDIQIYNWGVLKMKEVKMMNNSNKLTILQMQIEADQIAGTNFGWRSRVRICDQRSRKMRREMKTWEVREKI